MKVKATIFLDIDDNNAENALRNGFSADEVTKTIKKSILIVGTPLIWDYEVDSVNPDPMRIKAREVAEHTKTP